jgi:hypothetical protein
MGLFCLMYMHVVCAGVVHRAQGTGHRAHTAIKHCTHSLHKGWSSVGVHQQA